MLVHLLSAGRKTESYLMLTILLFAIVIDIYTFISKEKSQILILCSRITRRRSHHKKFEAHRMVGQSL